MSVWLFAITLLAQTIQTPEIHFGPIPAWVDPLAVDFQIPSDPNLQSGGRTDLLHSVQMEAASCDVFTRVAYRIENAVGLQNGAQVSLDIDPVHEELWIHSLVIHRNGEVVEGLQKENWRMIQQETDLDRFLYNGRFSAVAFIEDLRVGDVVEFSATVVQKKLLFGEKFFFLTPVIPNHAEVVQYRVVAPKDLPILTKSKREKFAPNRTDIGDRHEIVWSFQKDRDEGEEGSEPDDSATLDWVMATAYESWLDVQTQVTPLFEIDGETPWLDAWIEANNSRYAEREDRLRAVIRFVQDEIRYLGIEIGADSYIPSKPQDTFRRRFGDCKDKVQLLRSMLARYEITAHPVLVHTQLDGQLGNFLASPFLFDHVVAVFNWDGNLVGIDATASHERGRLSERPRLPYRHGLVLNGRDPSLANFEGPAPTVSVQIDYLLDIPGWGEDGRLQVTSTFQGEQANIERQDQDLTSRTALSEQLMAVQEVLYSRIELAEPVILKDDPDANRITRIETYRIPDMGSVDDEQDLLVMSAHPLLTYIGWPDSENPLWLPHHPVDLNMSYRIRLPETWPFEPQRQRIRNDIFEFDFLGKKDQGDYVFRWQFKSLSDHHGIKPQSTYREDVELLSMSFQAHLSRWGTMGACPWYALGSSFWNIVPLRLDSLFGLGLYGLALFYTFKIRRFYRQKQWSHWRRGGSNS